MTKPARIFKTAWFAKAARKAHISDAALCQAIRQAMLGQAVDMGGGVFKKRLNQNRHRGIFLAKTSHYWVLEYLFAKQNKANITPNELLFFRKLAGSYAALTNEQLQQLLVNGNWMELDNESAV